MEHTTAPATVRADKVTAGQQVAWKGLTWTVVRNAVTAGSAGYNMLYLDRPDRDAFKPVLFRWSDQLELV